MAVTRTAPVRERDETGKPTGPGVRDIGPAAARVTTFANAAAAAAEVVVHGSPMGSGPVERVPAPMSTDGRGDHPAVLHHRGYRAQEAETSMSAPEVHIEPRPARASRLSPEGAARIAAAAKARAERQRAEREARLEADQHVVEGGKAGPAIVGHDEGGPFEDRPDPILAAPARDWYSGEEPNVVAVPISSVPMFAIPAIAEQDGPDALVDGYRRVRDAALLLRGIGDGRLARSCEDARRELADAIADRIAGPA